MSRVRPPFPAPIHGDPRRRPNPGGFCSQLIRSHHARRASRFSIRPWSREHGHEPGQGRAAPALTRQTRGAARRRSASHRSRAAPKRVHKRSAAERSRSARKAGRTCKRKWAPGQGIGRSVEPITVGQPLARVRRSATASSIVVWLSGCRRTDRTGGGSEASFPRDSPSGKVTRRRLPLSMKPEDLDPRLILDQAPALRFSGRPNGYIDYVNQRWLEEIGSSFEAVQGPGWHLPRDLQSGRAAKGAALVLRRLSQRHGVPSSHIDRP